MFDDIDVDEFARLAALPLVPFVEALLDREAKASSADVCEAWHAVNPEPVVAKAEFKRIRDAWKRARTELGTVADETEQRVQQTADARAAAWEQLEAAITSGNTKKQAELVKTIKNLDALAPERVVADDGDTGWDRLTEAERECFIMLIRKKAGAPLDEDHEWFVGLLARVPERPWEVHPAHVPLPDAQRPAMLTP